MPSSRIASRRLVSSRLVSSRLCSLPSSLAHTPPPLLPLLTLYTRPARPTRTSFRVIFILSSAILVNAIPPPIVQKAVFFFIFQLNIPSRYGFAENQSRPRRKETAAESRRIGRTNSTASASGSLEFNFERPDGEGGGRGSNPSRGARGGRGARGKTVEESWKNRGRIAKDGWRRATQFRGSVQSAAAAALIAHRSNEHDFEGTSPRNECRAILQTIAARATIPPTLFPRVTAPCIAPARHRAYRSPD